MNSSAQFVSTFLSLRPLRLALVTRMEVKCKLLHHRCIHLMMVIELNSTEQEYELVRG